VGESASPTATDDTPASIDLDLSGVGASFTGGLGVSLEGRTVAAATIAGVGGDVAADLDLATVEWAAIARRFGIDVEVSGGGHARVSTAPFEASLDVDLSGAVAGMAVTLTGSAPNDLDFTVAGDGVDLSGRLAWD